MKMKKDDPARVYSAIIDSIMLSNGPCMSKSWLLTSAARGEGITMTSLGLALALTNRGRSVLLVDANLQRPAVHTYLRMDLEPGLVELLGNGCLLGEVCREISLFPGKGQLSVLTRGRSGDDPFNLFNLEQVKHFFNEAKSRFDNVIVDASDLESSVESLLLAPHVDGMILVVACGKARRDSVLEAKQRLIQTGGNLLGVVLNGQNDPVPTAINKWF